MVGRDRRLLAAAAPGLGLLLVGFLLPVAQVLWISVTEPVAGFGNYLAMVENPIVRRIATTTLRVCLITTGVTVVLGYVVAYVLTHVGARARRLLLLLCALVPFWLSVLARAFAWVTLLRGNGIVNNVLLGRHHRAASNPTVVASTSNVAIAPMVGSTLSLMPSQIARGSR